MDAAEARATVSSMYGGTLRRVRFDGLELISLTVGATWWLDRCSFVGTDLRQATLDRVSLRMCDLRNADLRGASLRGTLLGGCDLRGADLRDADLTGAQLTAVNTGRDDVGRTDVTGSRLEGAVLTDVTAEGVRGWPGRV